MVATLFAMWLQPCFRQHRNTVCDAAGDKMVRKTESVRASAYFLLRLEAGINVAFPGASLQSLAAV